MCYKTGQFYLSTTAVSFGGLPGPESEGPSPQSNDRTPRKGQDARDGGSNVRSWWELLLMVWGCSAIGMAVLHIVQRIRRDAGIVDVGWAAGVGLSALYYAIVADGDPARRAVLAVLGGIWGFRLAGYLLVDRVMSDGEDGRYASMREAWGENAQRNLFLFFQAQALGFFLCGTFIVSHHTGLFLFGVHFLDLGFHRLEIGRH